MNRIFTWRKSLGYLGIAVLGWGADAWRLAAKLVSMFGDADTLCSMARMQSGCGSGAIVTAFFAAHPWVQALLFLAVMGLFLWDERLRTAGLIKELDDRLSAALEASSLKEESARAELKVGLAQKEDLKNISKKHYDLDAKVHEIRDLFPQEMFNAIRDKGVQAKARAASLGATVDALGQLLKFVEKEIAMKPVDASSEFDLASFVNEIRQVQDSIYHRLSDTHDYVFRVDMQISNLKAAYKELTGKELV